MPRRRREPETAAIVSVTHDGRGIADVAGKKVFVTGALPGETVRFRRRRSRRSFDEAELLDVIDSSSERIQPRCAVFGRCGGCALQHVSHEQQLAIKTRALKDSFERLGQVSPADWLEPLTGPEWHYRRRARLAVKDVRGKGRVLVGFRERHAPLVTDMDRCEVLAKPAHELLVPLSDLIGGLSIRARLPQIEVAIAENGVALVFRVLDPPRRSDMELLARFGAAHACRIYLQTGGPASVAILWPENAEPLYFTIPEYGVRIDFEPVGFIQVNAEVNRALVGLATRLLDPQPGDAVLDLFCGLGNFSLPLARRAGRVLGIEGDPLLVAAARANAGANGFANLDVQMADLDRITGDESWLTAPWDRVLIDPARAGAAEVVRHIDRAGAKRIVYVSCHPGTLARDAGTLVHAHGYRLAAAGIIDMFPQTAHVESIAVFDKNI